MSEKTYPAILDHNVLGKDWNDLFALLIHVGDGERSQELHDTLTYAWQYLFCPSTIVFPNGQTLLELMYGIEPDAEDTDLVGADDTG